MYWVEWLNNGVDSIQLSLLNDWNRQVPKSLVNNKGQCQPLSHTVLMGMLVLYVPILNRYVILKPQLGVIRIHST